MKMKLKTLRIDRKTFGDDTGKFFGRVSFDNKEGSIDLVLTPEHCEKIFDVCADGILQVAKGAAHNLRISIEPKEAKPKAPDQPTRRV